MRNPIRNLMVLVALLSAGFAASAQPALKLVTVDLIQAYNGYWKTQEKEIQFADAKKKAEEQIAAYQAEGQKIVDEALALQEKANNDMLTQDARDTAAAALQEKNAAVQATRDKIQQYVTNADRQMQQRQRVHQELMLDEINEVVRAIGQARGATLILDTSGPTGVGISNVLYSDDGFDITAEVIAKLNESKPEDFQLKSPSAAPSPTPVPTQAPTP